MSKIVLLIVVIVGVLGSLAVALPQRPYTQPLISTTDATQNLQGTSPGVGWITHIQSEWRCRCPIGPKQGRWNSRSPCYWTSVRSGQHADQTGIHSRNQRRHPGLQQVSLLKDYDLSNSETNLIFHEQSWTRPGTDQNPYARCAG